jgi:hypothetical protein
MGTTPLWVPLVVAGIAVIGTLAGVIFTQVWNSRLEERRSARERDRLREAQAREDMNRTYDHRRAAYVDFLQELDRLMNLLHPSNREPITYGDPVYDELSNRWTLITVYGTEEADSLAYRCLDKLQVSGSHPDDDEVYMARAQYVHQIRNDLGVPERTPAKPRK